MSYQCKRTIFSKFKCTFQLQSCNLNVYKTYLKHSSKLNITKNKRLQNLANYTSNIFIISDLVIVYNNF